LKILLKTIIIFFILFSITIPSFSEEEEIVLVGNYSIPDSIKKKVIKQIFLGNKTRWDKNQKIVFVLYTDKKICNNFLKKYVGKTYIQYKNYWKKLVFTGKGNMPKTSKKIEGIIEYLSDTNGSISFLPIDAVDTKQIKIIHVDF